MTHLFPQTTRPAPSHNRLMARSIAIGVLALAGFAVLWSGSPVTADTVAATATQCVPGPDNFCPATPTPQALALRLYLVEIQRTDLALTQTQR